MILLYIDFVFSLYPFCARQAPFRHVCFVYLCHFRGHPSSVAGEITALSSHIFSRKDHLTFRVGRTHLQNELKIEVMVYGKRVQCRHGSSGVSQPSRKSSNKTKKMPTLGRKRSARRSCVSSVVCVLFRSMPLSCVL